MTGATGFLGSFLLRDLLQRGRWIVAMLREPLDENRRRLQHSLQQLGVDLTAYIERGQLVLVAGSLPDRLPDGNGYRVDDILSCAASLQLFSNGNEEPHKTNVTGTRRLIEWARRYDVRRIHAVSTAYVCGSYIQNVREKFHRPRPEFQTEYESSKWLAESHLCAWGAQDGNSLTVYRPSLLVGDSRSGYTTQYGGFYQFARMVSLLKERYGEGDNGNPTYIPLRIPGRPDDPQNFVPVDFVSRIVAEVITNEELHGRVYHLTDPTPPTNGQVKRYLEDYFNMHGGYFADRKEVINNCTPAESLLWEHYEVVTPRVTHNPRFEQDLSLIHI